MDRARHPANPKWPFRTAFARVVLTQKTPPTASGVLLARWRRLEGSLFASRTLMLANGGRCGQRSLERWRTYAGFWQRRTRRGPAAMRFFMQLINEDCFYASLASSEIIL